MRLEKNTVEILLNFNDRFIRTGDDLNGNSRRHYLDSLLPGTENVTFEQLNERANIYSAQWHIEVANIFAGSVGLTATRTATTGALTKSKFSQFYQTGIEKEMIKFPFSFIDFTAFDTFRNANNVAGRLTLKFDEQNDCFKLEGDFVTRPPVALNGYAPTFAITSNKDLFDAIEKMSAVFGQVGGN